MFNTYFRIISTIDIYIYIYNIFFTTLSLHSLSPSQCCCWVALCHLTDTELELPKNMQKSRLKAKKRSLHFCQWLCLIFLFQVLGDLEVVFLNLPNNHESCNHEEHEEHIRNPSAVENAKFICILHYTWKNTIQYIGCICCILTKSKSVANTKPI